MYYLKFYGAKSALKFNSLVNAVAKCRQWLTKENYPAVEVKNSKNDTIDIAYVGKNKYAYVKEIGGRDIEFNTDIDLYTCFLAISSEKE